ncbi:hypothetical protein EGH25_08635 [Haladaptatus sp. F3-133]|uniref:Uncharacterized protein n=1 Tax=Halorutilus salinus TaxID=2487751 RepID=A0A9Q4C5E0_9EURY|nr:hypothetical protein [Halorutilus salinus]MCX2819415.1 hypothetical protein [Halorutilus salinus]
MSGSDGDEKREWAVVALSAILILVLTPVVVSMMIEAWETDGFVWETAASLTIDRGYDIGLVVAVPAGLALGWILLFALDESKKVQAVVVPAFAVIFAGVVWSRGLWFGDTVDWSANGVPFVASFATGLVTGGGAEYLNHRRRSFKRAGWLLYLSVTTGTAVALVQLAVEGGMGVTEGVVNAGSTVALLVVLSVFVEYENERSISVLATSEKPRATVVGGLCKTVRDENLNHKFRGEGAEKMVRALSTLENDGEMLPDLEGTVSFRYKDTTSLISRWVSVTAEGVDARYVQRQMDLNTEQGSRNRTVEGAVSVASKPLRSLVPPFVRGGSRRTGSLADRLDGSDLVLVTVSFPELVSDDEIDQRSVETVKDILRRYSESGPETVLAVTEAEKALERYENEMGGRPLLNDGKLEDYIRMEVLGGYLGADIVSVSVEKNTNLGDGSLSWEDMRILLGRMSG